MSCWKRFSDLAAHLIAARGLGVPGSHRESFEALRSAGLLSVESAAEMGAMAALRNRIARTYGTLDPVRMVREAPHGLDAVTRFVDQLTSAVTDELGSRGRLAAMVLGSVQRFLMTRILLASLLGLAVGCGASETRGDGGRPLEQVVDSCEVGAPLTGADYDIRKSKFAFGSTPVKTVDGTLTRWTGTQGVLAIEASGSTLGVMNAAAEETSVADWSADTDALEEHVRSYFVGMGVAKCQIENANILGSSGSPGGSSSSTVSLARVVDGIRIGESHAFARSNSHDLTTSEGFYWPTISARIVTEARAFRDQLLEATALAAFKAKLPTNAHGEGVVVIHHSTDMPTASFEAMATYDVISGRSQLSFARDGQPVTPPM